jgi:hypothetical protein
MPPDLRNDTTWPDYPFVAVKSHYGDGTAVSLSRGTHPRKVLLAPIQTVLARHATGETVADIDATTPSQDYHNLADLGTDWKTV